MVTDGWLLHVAVVAPNSTGAAVFVIHESLTCNSLRFMTCHFIFFLFALHDDVDDFEALVRPFDPHYRIIMCAILPYLCNAGPEKH